MRRFIIFIIYCFTSNLSAQINHGSSLHFEGDLDYVEIADSPELTPSSMNITLEAWIKPDSVFRSQSILTKYNSFAGTDQVSWALLTLESGAIRFGIYESFQKGQAVDTNDSLLTAGEWQHVAATFDSTTQAWRIYLDGIEVPVTSTAGSTEISSISDSNTPVRIGTIVPIAGNLDLFWAGNIDEVRIWNSIRSRNQLQSTDFSLVVYYTPFH